MKYPNGHSYYCWLDGEQAEFMEQLVREGNKRLGAKGKEAASVGGVISSVMGDWIATRRKREQSK